MFWQSACLYRMTTRFDHAPRLCQSDSPAGLLCACQLFAAESTNDMAAVMHTDDGAGVLWEGVCQ